MVDISLSEEVPLEKYEDKFVDLSAEIATLNARTNAIHRFGRTERQMEEEVSHPHNVLDELKTCGIML